MNAAETVAAAIRAHRFYYATEVELQAGIAAALKHDGFDVQREYRLSDRDRVDLLVIANGGPAVEHVAVEVKVKGRGIALGNQLARYAQSSEVDALVGVTNRAHHGCERRYSGKPCELVRLGGVV